MSVDIDKETLLENSRIYRNPKSRYENNVNDAAFELCCENPNLVKNKGSL